MLVATAAVVAVAEGVGGPKGRRGWRAAYGHPAGGATQISASRPARRKRQPKGRRLKSKLILKTTAPGARDAEILHVPRSSLVVVAEGVAGRPEADRRGGRAAYNHLLIPARKSPRPDQQDENAGPRAGV